MGLKLKDIRTSFIKEQSPLHKAKGELCSISTKQKRKRRILYEEPLHTK